MNVQVTRVFSPVFEVYVGGETLVITNRKKPFLEPMILLDQILMLLLHMLNFGQMYYAGLRFRIK
jgi:hypothetical protein